MGITKIELNNIIIVGELGQQLNQVDSISLEINSVIKESSLDCIQHTKDDPELNDKCIRFSDKLSGEIAYFPGISAKVLENIDIIQLKAKY